jgi:hypothetical protein
VDVRVAVGHRRHARAEELVLRVGRHDAGRALAVELDLVGARQDVQRRWMASGFRLLRRSSRVLIERLQILLTRSAARSSWAGCSFAPGRARARPCASFSLNSCQPS